MKTKGYKSLFLIGAILTLFMQSSIAAPQIQGASFILQGALQSPTNTYWIKNISGGTVSQTQLQFTAQYIVGQPLSFKIGLGGEYGPAVIACQVSIKTTLSNGVYNTDITTKGLNNYTCSANPSSGSDSKFTPTIIMQGPAP